MYRAIGAKCVGSSGSIIPPDKTSNTSLPLYSSAIAEMMGLKP
jgi:hypothetical protein